jgi:hypothetical protein
VSRLNAQEEKDHPSMVSVPRKPSELFIFDKIRRFVLEPWLASEPSQIGRM